MKAGRDGGAGSTADGFFSSAADCCLPVGANEDDVVCVDEGIGGLGAGVVAVAG